MAGLIGAVLLLLALIPLYGKTFHNSPTTILRPSEIMKWSHNRRLTIRRLDLDGSSLQPDRPTAVRGMLIKPLT